MAFVRRRMSCGTSTHGFVADYACLSGHSGRMGRIGTRNSAGSAYPITTRPSLPGKVWVLEHRSPYHGAASHAQRLLRLKRSSSAGAIVDRLIRLNRRCTDPCARWGGRSGEAAAYPDRTAVIMHKNPGPWSRFRRRNCETAHLSGFAWERPRIFLNCSVRACASACRRIASYRIARLFNRERIDEPQFVLRTFHRLHTPDATPGLLG